VSYVVLKSDAYSIVHIPKSLHIHRMALTSTGWKIEHNKVTDHTQTYELSVSVSLKSKFGILSS